MLTRSHIRKTRALPRLAFDKSRGRVQYITITYSTVEKAQAASDVKEVENIAVWELTRGR
jgi:hypothetical protein